MSATKLNKEQVKKIALSAMGFVGLIYVYFTFFLGPLAHSRDTMLASIKDKQGKLDSSKDEIAKASTLERQATAATTRFAAFKALNPEGAPIAWFPPRVKVFFANEQIEKANARLENNAPCKEPELAAWMRYNWLIDIPQADYAQLGKAIADLENQEPLLAISKVSIRGGQEQAEFQTVNLLVSNFIPKK
jgi:hypothetical protein